VASHYDVLGVPATASPEEVRRAYHERARLLHPDRAGDARAMQDVNEAWRVLRDAGSRAAYDRTLAAPVRVHDADDPADWRYNRPTATSGDIGVSIARSLPWIAVLFVLGVIFVFTAFARTGDDSSGADLIGRCITLDAGEPLPVACDDPSALGRVSLLVDRQSRCPSETTPLAVAGDRWFCMRPTD
jgi:hypothetical protein